MNAIVFAHLSDLRDEHRNKRIKEVDIKFVSRVLIMFHTIILLIGLLSIRFISSKEYLEPHVIYCEPEEIINF